MEQGQEIQTKHKSLLRYAFDKEKKLVSIDSVDRGLACNCTCPSCNGILIAKKGEFNEYHFAHQSVECKYAAETTLHLLAKEVLTEMNTLKLPLLRVTSKHSKKSLKFYENKVICFDFVFIEKTIENIRPDAIVYANDFPSETEKTPILVEFCVTHLVDEVKMEKIESLNLFCIEIKLPKKLLSANKNEIKDYLSKTNDFYWINHPETSEIKEALEIDFLQYQEEKRKEEEEKERQKRKEEKEKKEREEKIRRFAEQREKEKREKEILETEKEIFWKENYAKYPSLYFSFDDVAHFVNDVEFFNARFYPEIKPPIFDYNIHNCSKIERVILKNICTYKDWHHFILQVYSKKHKQKIIVTLAIPCRRTDYEYLENDSYFCANLSLYGTHDEPNKKYIGRITLWAIDEKEWYKHYKLVRESYADFDRNLVIEQMKTSFYEYPEIPEKEEVLENE